MRFKVDENLPTEAVDLLREAGHDALSVLDQGLRGTEDGAIVRIVKEEDRALITLDLDFSDIRAYPPSEHPGLIVLRLRDANKERLLDVLQRALPTLARGPLAGALWIVEEDRLRVRE